MPNNNKKGWGTEDIDWGTEDIDKPKTQRIKGKENVCPLAEPCHSAFQEDLSSVMLWFPKHNFHMFLC